MRKLVFSLFCMLVPFFGHATYYEELAKYEYFLYHLDVSYHEFAKLLLIKDMIHHPCNEEEKMIAKTNFKIEALTMLDTAMDRIKRQEKYLKQSYDELEKCQENKDQHYNTLIRIFETTKWLEENKVAIDQFEPWIYSVLNEEI